MKRKRNHDSLADTLLNPKPFTSRYTDHGNKYEPVALLQYETFICPTRRPFKVFKSGLVISLELPILGASPDGKVIDSGCTEQYGLVEVKFPATKFNVTPLDACSDPGFCFRKKH